MTRAYKWQLQQKALGNCLWCGKPANGFSRCETHRKWFREYARKLRLKNLDKSREYERNKARKLHAANPDKIRSRQRRYYSKNKERMRQIANDARAKNLTKFRNRDKARRNKVYQRKKERWHSDPVYKLGMQLRHSLYRSLRRKSVNKTCSALKLLGCSIDNFVIYIESQFDVGMNWSNWGNGEGSWHLDHIVPIALFDISKESHRQRCFHFSNMRPLWAAENLKKNAKFTSSHQFDLL